MNQEALKSFPPMNPSRVPAAHRMAPTTLSRDPLRSLLQEQRGCLFGWTVSAVLHGALVAWAILVMATLRIVPPEPRAESFQWNVSLIMAPPPEIFSTDALAPSLPPEDAMAAASIDPRVADSDGEAPSHLDGVLATDASGQESIARSDASREHAANDLPTRPGLQSAQDTFPFAESATAARLPPDVEALQQAERPELPTRVEVPNVVQRPRPISRPIVQRTTLPDYGWLLDALHEKLKQVKYYPSLARANKWQGRVVIQVRVCENGHLVHPEIEESSGYGILDNAALDTLRRASPVVLAHRLDRDQVTISVPISYHLE